MSLPEERSDRRGIAGQFGRFVGAGAVNSLLTFVLYEVLHLFWPYWLAFTIAFAAGIAFAAVVNARLVFAYTLTVWSLVRFTAFYLSSYAISLAVLMFLVEKLHVPSALAPLAVIAVMVPFNFLGSRLALRQAPP